MKNGDRVRYKIDGRTGTADEFLHDGEAFITWDDGTFGAVNWSHLELLNAEQAAQKEDDNA